MAGRPKGSGAGVRMSDAHRAKIRAVNIINALQEHVEGNREMSGTQVAAGLGLLKKVLPDMTESMIKGAGEDGAIKVEMTAPLEKLRAFLAK